MIAPSFDEESLDILRTKKNLRLLEIGEKVPNNDSSLFKCNIGRSYAIHLTCPYTKALTIFCHHNCIGFYMFYNIPSKNEAYHRAYEADSVSAFGGIIAVNRPMDKATAEQIVTTFMEAVIAPSCIGFYMFYNIPSKNQFFHLLCRRCFFRNYFDIFSVYVISNTKQLNFVEG